MITSGGGSRISACLLQDFIPIILWGIIAPGAWIIRRSEDIPLLTISLHGIFSQVLNPMCQAREQLLGKAMQCLLSIQGLHLILDGFVNPTSFWIGLKTWLNQT